MKLVQWISPNRPSESCIETWLAQLTANDVLLLRQDGVYAMLLAWPAELQCRCCVLQVDVEARAIVPKAHWQTISDQQWVALAAQAEPVVLCPIL